MTFIERLEQLRQEKGITRKKLLEDCKLGKNQFTYWRKIMPFRHHLYCLFWPVTSKLRPSIYWERVTIKKKKQVI